MSDPYTSMKYVNRFQTRELSEIKAMRKCGSWISSDCYGKYTSIPPFHSPGVVIYTVKVEREHGNPRWTY